MFQAYFESLKYVGLMFPISFLRIFLGYYYIQKAVHDWQTHILGNSLMSDFLAEALNKSNMPFWYRYFLTEHLVNHWALYAFILVALQLIIGVSYIIGYVVRPSSMLGLFLCLNLLIVSNSNQEFLFKLLIACHIILGWVGAGRCLGFDYYFYKRYRGMWW